MWFFKCLAVCLVYYLQVGSACTIEDFQYEECLEKPDILHFTNRTLCWLDVWNNWININTSVLKTQYPDVHKQLKGNTFIGFATEVFGVCTLGLQDSAPSLTDDYFRFNNKEKCAWLKDAVVNVEEFVERTKEMLGKCDLQKSADKIIARGWGLY